MDFGHEGLLFRMSFVMYDKQTNSLWVHTTGQAVRGELKGKQLEFLPSEVMRWKDWKAAHPDTLVWDASSDGYQSFNLEASGSQQDRYGLSVGQGRHAKLFPLGPLALAGCTNDVAGDEQIAVVFDARTGTARAFARGERVLSWSDDTLVDVEGHSYDPRTGVCETPGGIDLEPVAATAWLVDRWHGFYPLSPVYGDDSSRPEPGQD